MITLLKWMGISFAAWCSLIGVATAGVFDGKTIHYQYFFHESDTMYSHASNGDHVVGSGVEIANVVDGYGTLDFSGDGFVVNFDRGTSFNSATFNGFVISVLPSTLIDFTSFSLESNTGVAGTPVLNFDANHLSVNWQGLGFHGGSLHFITTSLTPDLATADSATSPVPEPDSYAMFMAGLGLMGFMARRRKNG
jgi:PEP-CTERM motif